MPASFHLIVDRTTPEKDLLAALSGGVDVVQLRDKGASALDLYERARAVLPMIEDHGARLFINDRLDVALAVAASGAHLGGRSLPPAVARRLAPGLLLGTSVHSLAEAKNLAGWADYLTFGQVFPSLSHPGQAAAGLEGLSAVAAAVSCPVLAIGGVSADNAAAVLAAGAAGVVVISAVLATADVAAAARRLRQVLDRCPDPVRPDPATLGGGVSR